jgi:purine-binding chemotaxis protein CheW
VINRYDARNFLAFTVDNIEYAVHIAGVKEIVNPIAISALPKRPNGILGVAELRKQVVPILDLRLRLGLSLAPVTRRTKWILLEVGRERLALQVENVVGVFRAEVGDERAAPELLSQDELCRVLFVTKRQNAMVFALDLAPFEALASSLQKAEAT